MVHDPFLITDWLKPPLKSYKRLYIQFYSTYSIYHEVKRSRWMLINWLTIISVVHIKSNSIRLIADKAWSNTNIIWVQIICLFRLFSQNGQCIMACSWLVGLYSHISVIDKRLIYTDKKLINWNEYTGGNAFNKHTFYGVIEAYTCMNRHAIPEILHNFRVGCTSPMKHRKQPSQERPRRVTWTQLIHKQVSYTITWVYFMCFWCDKKC